MMAARQGGRAGYGSYNYSRTAYRTRQAYVYGNTVPKPAYEPERRRERREDPARRRRTSRQVRSNRRRALRMNAGYVAFLAVAALTALILCVNYVNLQSRITRSSNHITALQEELADMREENNTRYNSVMDSVNLEEVREKARNELGMVYASEGQVIEYENPLTDYVKQYENIPEDGVIARADKHVD